MPGYAKHSALVPALELAAAAAGLVLETGWIPSAVLAADARAALAGLDAAVAAPQSPDYCQDPDGLIAGLRLARQRGLYCLAVCGGAQFALREHVSSQRGEAAAGSLLREAFCDRVGESGYRVEGYRPVRLQPGTQAISAYGRAVVQEPFACTYVVEDAAAEWIFTSGVRSAGVTEAIGTTLFEWADHPFYVAALFLPQWNREQPHPLFISLLTVASSRQSGSPSSAP